MWVSKLKKQRKRWLFKNTINCWGSTNWDIGIPASYSPLSWIIPTDFSLLWRTCGPWRKVPLWGKPATALFEFVLLITVNSRKNSRAVTRPLPGTRRWAVQIWDTRRLWHYFIFVAEVSIFGSLFFLFPLDILWILFQMPLLLSTLSHNCLLGHWNDSPLGIKCSRDEVSSAPCTS